MASSLALGCGKVFLNADKEAPRFSRLKLQNRRFMMRSTCFNENEDLQGRGGNMTSRLSIYAPDSCKLREKKMNFYEDPNPVSLDKLDEWMRESVTEIVRNIGEAPFLVHVYANKGDGSSSTTTRLERELAMSEEWPYAELPPLINLWIQLWYNPLRRSRMKNPILNHRFIIPNSIRRWKFNGIPASRGAPIVGALAEETMGWGTHT